jgi:hypothetical protein
MALLFAFSVTIPNSASAQTQQPGIERLTMSPTSKRQQLKPGSQLNDTFTVINDGQTAYDFKVYASPYYVKNEQYEPLFNTQAGQRDASPWVQFQQKNFTLNPGQRLEVPYTILVPANTAPGGHYAVLFAETISKANPRTTGIGRNKRVGSVLLANVEGTVKRSGSVIDNSTSFLQLSPPLTASLRIRNDGNIDFDSKVTMQVYDVLGRLKYRTQNTFVIFPNTTRRTQVVWNEVPFVGIYRVNQTAELLGRTETSSKYVLIMPSWMIITLIIIIGATVAGFFVRRRANR